MCVVSTIKIENHAILINSSKLDIRNKFSFESNDHYLGGFRRIRNFGSFFFYNQVDLILEMIFDSSLITLFKSIEHGES